ncbi:trypsin-like serine protease [Rothia sp. 11254D007CT]
MKGRGPPAAQVNGVTGAANHGDSGGPLIVGGRVVGVCSKGDTNDPGANINAGSQYALLNQSSAWIQRTTGLNFAGTFSDGRDTQLN